MKGRKVLLQTYAGSGVHRAVHHDDGPAGHGVQRAVGAAQYLVDSGIVDDADAEDVAGRSQVGRRRRDRSGRVREWFERLGASCPQRRRVARVDDSASHRRTLAAEAYEADSDVLLGRHRRARPALHAAS